MMLADMTTDQLLSSLSSAAVDSFVAAQTASGGSTATASPADVQMFLAGLPVADRAAAAQALIAAGVPADVANGALSSLTWKFPKWLAVVLGIAAGAGASVALERRRR